jgi:hypothetical protein
MSASRRPRGGRADAAGDQVLVGEDADANGDVEPFLDEVVKSVVHDKFDAKLRILGQQSAEPRRNQKPAEGGGTADTHETGWRHPAGADRSFSFGQRLEDLAAAFVELAPLIGEAQGTGRSTDQSRAQMLFEGKDLFADGRLSDLQFLRDARKAMYLGDTDESSHRRI